MVIQCSETKLPKGCRESHEPVRLQVPFLCLIHKYQRLGIQTQVKPRLSPHGTYPYLTEEKNK